MGRLRLEMNPPGLELFQLFMKALSPITTGDICHGIGLGLCD